MRISRAWHIRPQAVQGWDYWKEYIPALNQIVKIPIADELLFAVFGGKKSASKLPFSASTRQMTSREERLAIFNDLKKEAEARKNGTKD